MMPFDMIASVPVMGVLSARATRSWAVNSAKLVIKKTINNNILMRIPFSLCFLSYMKGLISI
jgi:hypothetical protein